MKTYFKKNQGISLVALVITIIVLIILAGVAITTLSGRENIITKAQEAKATYQNDQYETKKMLNSQQEYIDLYTGGEVKNQEQGESQPIIDPIVGTYAYGEKATVTFYENGTWQYSDLSTGSWTRVTEGKYQFTSFPVGSNDDIWYIDSDGDIGVENGDAKTFINNKNL